MSNIDQLLNTAKSMTLDVTRSHEVLSLHTPATESGGSDNSCLWKGCYQRYSTTKDLFEHVKEVHIGRKRNGNVNLQCNWSDCQTEFPKVVYY